ncbi:hypothetical protein BDR06DRAFT_63785 [Suillus hirtellus]|nr:hypothetical protein BDR06DRAFT_63785 [Suillus hirtellus]
MLSAPGGVIDPLRGPYSLIHTGYEFKCWAHLGQDATGYNPFHSPMLLLTASLQLALLFADHVYYVTWMTGRPEY